MSRTLVALLVLLLLAALAHASPVRRQDSGNCTPVIFNSTIPAQLCASPDGSTVDSAETDLQWQGGNGRYNFFRTMSNDDTVGPAVQRGYAYIDADPQRFYYLHNSSYNHITVSMSVMDHYPSGTTL